MSNDVLRRNRINLRFLKGRNHVCPDEGRRSLPLPQGLKIAFLVRLAAPPSLRSPRLRERIEERVSGEDCGGGEP